MDRFIAGSEANSNPVERELAAVGHRLRRRDAYLDVEFGAASSYIRDGEEA